MNMNIRLDQLLVQKGLVPTRSQAESWIKLGSVTVEGRAITKPGFFVAPTAKVQVNAKEQYVSRAGLKLASAAQLLSLNFTEKIVLDVGSSTGGFTDYALRHGAKKVIAIDVGTNQLHPSLRYDPAVELHEKTDIRRVTARPGDPSKLVIEAPDLILIDVSFISLREIIPHLCRYVVSSASLIVAMVKPQFEAGRQQVNKGVIKNDTKRRQVLKAFETWVKQYAVTAAKADSEITGSKGNRERFYLLRPQLSKIE